MSVATTAGVLTGLRKPSIPAAELLRRTYTEVIEDDCFGMAAQLAYYFALALFPALIFVVALVSYLPFDVLDNLIAMIDRVAPTEISRLIHDQIRELMQGQNGGLLTIGVLGAVWTSSSALVSIVATLNRAYDVTESRPWWKVRLVSILLTIGLVLFMISALVLLFAGPLITRTLETTFGFGSAAATVWNLAQWPLVFALASLGIAIVYYFAPDVDQDWVWITPGSILACLLWIVVSLGLRLYLAYFGNYNETYGTLGGAAILLLWAYLSSVAILIGGEINAEIEHALPDGKAPGERSPGERVRLRAFSRRPFEYPIHPPQPSRVI
jgi:membrane protein